LVSNCLRHFDRKVVLLPLKWETHSSPELGRRPQDIINKEVVDYCDMAVGVFWTRIGSPTGTHPSGTIEEIERVGKDGKIVMLYFSKAKIEPDSIDLEQYQSLKEFKKKNYPNGLVESYSDIVDFRDKFAKQLEIKLRTLIASDSDESVSLSDASTPKFEINLVDYEIDSVVKNKSTLTIETNELINIDKVPDYKIPSENSDFRRGFVDENYYRELITGIIEDENAKVFTLNLSNLGLISIRDIFCELKIVKDDGFIIGQKTRNFNTRHLDRMSQRRLIMRKFGINYNEENLLPIKNDEGVYYMTFKYDALQPQRNVTIPNGFIYNYLGQKTLKLQFTIYADCFATPLVNKLEFKIKNKKTKVDALDIIKELKLIQE